MHLDRFDCREVGGAELDLTELVFDRGFLGSMNAIEMSGVPAVGGALNERAV